MYHNFQADGPAENHAPVEHNRRQESLEGELDHMARNPLTPEDLQYAGETFQRLLHAYGPTDQKAEKYKRLVLLDTMYMEVADKDSFLRYFYLFLENEMWDQRNKDLEISTALARYRTLDLTTNENIAKIRKSLDSFADHLLNSFFLPLKACGPTPQPSSSAPRSELPKDMLHTEGRAKNLRRDCLERDGHRCVISGKFDRNEANRLRVETQGPIYDDDGQLVPHNPEQFAPLEVCHIIPHAIAEPPTGMDKSTNFIGNMVVWHILRMFDQSIGTLISGPNIDQPYNALCLEMSLHGLFGGFQIYLEPVRDKDNTFEIRTWDPGYIAGTPLPVTRTLRSDPKGRVRGPLRGLLAIHRAIGNILFLSGAGDYVETLLEEIEDMYVVAEDGSTALDNILNSRLGCWSEIRVH